jgi:hypothetical protein
MFNQVYRFEKEDILTISHWFLPVNLFTAVATIFETTENCQCQQLTPQVQFGGFHCQLWNTMCVIEVQFGRFHCQLWNTMCVIEVQFGITDSETCQTEPPWNQLLFSK